MHGHAAVDVEDLPGDEIRVRRGQEEDRSRQILGQLIALDGPSLAPRREQLRWKRVVGCLGDGQPGVTTLTVMPKTPTYPILFRVCSFTGTPRRMSAMAGIVRLALR
ncbi:MAG: hypothetical protein ABSA02_31945 [Trebonia sp.]